MNQNNIWIDGTINTPLGFKACGTACGIKKSNENDLAVIACDVPAIACGVFTKNVIKGHSLKRTMQAIKGGMAHAIIINSGNANACVGKQGDDDANEMAKMLAEVIHTDPAYVMTGSTGVIGKKLPMDKLKKGISQVGHLLRDDLQSGHDAQRAIMTTDKIPKEFCARIEIADSPVHIAGIAKGSGMIHPNMATMISIITTDCNISLPLLDQMLKNITAKTFNRVSVDGDTSVCDMVVLMSSCLAAHPLIETSDTPEYEQFKQALEELCVRLSKLIASDGEGATKLLEIDVLHAETPKDAYLAAVAIAKSPLVKTAMFGEDANVGRIITAVGYSGANFDPTKCSICYNDYPVFMDGAVLPFDEAKAKVILSEKEIRITVDLITGPYSDRIWTCDFSYDYVRINGSYRS